MEHKYPDRRKEYMSPAEKIEQAKRIIPVVEQAIAEGETRQLFLDILEAQRKVLKDYGV